MASIEIWAADPKVVTIANASGAFTAGDLVQLDTSGEVKIAAAGKCHGIARKTSTGSSSTYIPIELLDPNGLYVVDYATGTATTEALIGDLVTISSATSGAQTFTNSSGAEALVVALHPEDGAQSSTSTTYDKKRRLIVRFVSAYIDATAS